jgi:hypothetical protein
VEFEITRPRLGFTLTDVADSLVLGVTPMGGASDVGVSLSWEEVGA